MFSMETSSAWRAEVPPPTSVPEVVVSDAAEDTTWHWACWPWIVLTSAPAHATGASPASASSLVDLLEAFNGLLVVVKFQVM